MATKLDQEFVATLPPSYFDENIGAPLTRVAIALAVLQTVFIALFLTARIVNKQAKGREFWAFMPLAYIICMANCAISICKYSTWSMVVIPL